MIYAKTQTTSGWKALLNKSNSGETHALHKHQKNALLFLSVQTPNDLCRLLADGQFFKLQNQINYPVYQHHIIAKKKGGKREIYSPCRELKTMQRRLNYYLQAYYLWIKPKEVHGFVINPTYLEMKCNIVENAKSHVNKKVLLNIDLQDFFPSISARRVKEIFSSSFFDFDEQIATALTLLSTFEGKLIIGAPTSPVISNFVCAQLDIDLIDFAKNNSLTYTRYADDLTFSTDAEISKQVLLELKLIIEKNKFKINEKKLRIRTSNRKQSVTGLTVNEKVNIDRKLLKKVRAMIFDLKKNGLEYAAKRHFENSAMVPDAGTYFLNRLRGYVDFIGQVKGKDDLVYLKYYQLITPVTS